MKPTFVHLRLHTEYSLIDSVVRIKPLVGEVAKHGMPAVAMTDQANLFGMVKFYRSAISAGVQPIFGSDFAVKPSDSKDPPNIFCLICQNDQGYKHLTEIVSEAYTHGQSGGVPLIEKDWLRNRTEGLIALSGGRLGELGRAISAESFELAASLIEEYKLMYPNRFYIELQRTGRDGEEHYNNHAMRLASIHNVPVVATNDVRFLQKDDFNAHEVRVCIHDGRVLDDPRRPKLYTDEQYLKSPEEMIELFSDVPQAVENTVEIAKRCSLSLSFGEYFLPEYPIPQGDTIETYFTRVCEEGLEKRLKELQADEPWTAEKIQSYHDRLKVEIKVILDMGFPGYFLIVADFILWAKNNGVPVGPGRGSGAGSIVAYAMEITDIDPIEYDLLFERFLNPERVSMPDFDVDFCMEGRDRVISYVADTYGKDQVSQIITYGTLAAKAVIRDVGRVMSHGYGFVDGIAKMIPFEPGMTLTKAMDMTPELKERYDSDDEVRGIIDMGLTLEGLSRNTGKHAGGVVIAPKKLTAFTPLYCEEGGGGLVTQFDKDDVESIGLVKFDFLGLRNLTVIDWAMKEVDKRRAANGEEPLNIERLPLDDKPTFDLLKAQQTTAIFQLESSGMKALIKKLQPDCFEDIIALVALYRPGPLDSGMVDDFVRRKHGQDEVSYPHPDYQYEGLKPVLDPTYGIILYQEQVMQIAQVMAGYTLGGADMLRRAMGKKKPEEMAKQKEVFIEGCNNNNIEPKLAENIFDLVEKFAGYGFNKSHSAAYAMVSYQTAFLKAHYPAEFMSAVLSADMDNTDKVVILIEECRSMKLKISPPSVNASTYKFSVQDEQTILYGLGALKGVGQGVIETIVEERETNGAFKGLLDLCRRVDAKKLNRRSLEALIRGGALDCLGEEMGSNRASLLAGVDDALKMSTQHHKNTLSGQVDIFGMCEEDEADDVAIELPNVPAWDDEFRLQEEKSILGLYLTGHPYQKYAKELSKVSKKTLKKHLDSLDTLSGGEKTYGNKNEPSIRASGLIVEARYITTKTNRRMAELTLDDQTARLSVILGDQEIEQFGDRIVKDKVLLVEGTLGLDFRDNPRVKATEIFTIDQAREFYAIRLHIKMTSESATQATMDALKDALTPYVNQGGQCKVVVHYNNHTAKAPVYFGDAWNVVPKESLMADLRQLLGADCVTISYK